MKIKEIKPCIVTWPTFTPRNIDVILTRLRIGHSRLTQRHLLLAEDTRTCYSFILIIRHLLTDCVSLCHMYRHYFHSSSPSLTYLIGENPHPEHVSFYHYI